MGDKRGCISCEKQPKNVHKTGSGANLFFKSVFDGRGIQILVYGTGNRGFHLGCKKN